MFLSVLVFIYIDRGRQKIVNRIIAGIPGVQNTLNYCVLTAFVFHCLCQIGYVFDLCHTCRIAIYLNVF
jgi:hypothetical protein